MGKRSSFERRPRDFYPTPEAALRPLIRHLPPVFAWWEPCAGDGRLTDWIGAARPRAVCLRASDIEPASPRVAHGDALTDPPPPGVNLIITNPPWSRPVLHALIDRFLGFAPSWLLFDADWIHTRQAAPFLPYLEVVQSVGRVKWIEGSRCSGKENAAWHLFTTRALYTVSPPFTAFYGPPYEADA
jgi:hypothetical protein